MQNKDTWPFLFYLSYFHIWSRSVLEVQVCDTCEAWCSKPYINHQRIILIIQEYKHFWSPARCRDNSDAQYRSFRNNLPVFVSHVLLYLLSHAFRYLFPLFCLPLTPLMV